MAFEHEDAYSDDFRDEFYQDMEDDGQFEEEADLYEDFLDGRDEDEPYEDDFYPAEDSMCDMEPSDWGYDVQEYE